LFHNFQVCNSGAWVACRPSRPRSPLDWSVQVSHADWTATCSPGPVHTPDWTDWTMKNTAYQGDRYEEIHETVAILVVCTERTAGPPLKFKGKRWNT
jgi:hypothetical protein